MLRLSLCVLTVILTSRVDAQEAVHSKFTDDQQLVIAAFELDVAKVNAILEKGANVDARLGIYDAMLFRDKWTLAYSSIGSDRWTPLLAVAHSHRAPQPAEAAENTSEGRRLSQKRLLAVDPKLILARDEKRLAIAKRLIDAKANLDLDDGYGDTALSAAVYLGYENVSLLLIAAGAKLDTRTGVYIDGTDNIAPVHRATKSPRVLEAMIKRGVNIHVKDGDGHTPLHWAIQDRNDASVKLLVNAGADPHDE
jgi:hypothetical protein